MTTITAVQDRINSLVGAMIGKGLIQPDAHYTIKANATAQIYLSWKKRPLDRYDQDNHEYKLFDAKDGPGDALTDADEFIRAMPDKAERDRQLFMEQLGETIETGKRIGIEDGFVNPLLDMMKKLSESAITHQPE